MAPLCYRRHRFPPEIIQHAISPALPISAASKAAFIADSHISAGVSRGDRSVPAAARTDPEARLGRSLPVVWPGFYTACDRGIVSEVLVRRRPATVLDHGASLDHEGD